MNQKTKSYVTGGQRDNRRRHDMTCRDAVSGVEISQRESGRSEWFIMCFIYQFFLLDVACETHLSLSLEGSLFLIES